MMIRVIIDAEADRHLHKRQQTLDENVPVRLVLF